MDNLHLLELAGNGLTGEIPAELGRLDNLRSLDLSYHRLVGPMPLSLTALTALEQLIFDNTELCAPRDKAFQEWLQGIRDVRGANCEL